ncbi:hypothetical protein H310_14805 [Aphanomyces invadans]|uniref:Uncharacterized protein n=1 Tax=Aphanomyces invadans TaxID=157072 RepID=A0A024TAT2_9STRA|nr:hypothetical protein H310_14805 [Aphanomyces invadans]ETV90402.1 hypothetical protein H310_14805 [Aphanomyces invadans]|eukprot:XP_008880958.1 hypothetical protein H310_14805 [Aphanomyces invadans]
MAFLGSDVEADIPLVELEDKRLPSKHWRRQREPTSARRVYFNAFYRDETLLTTPRRVKNSTDRSQKPSAACITGLVKASTAVTSPYMDWPFRDVPDDDVREDCARRVMTTTGEPSEPLVAGQIAEDSAVPLVKAVIQHRQLLVEVYALVDTGASVSVINPDIWRLLGSPPLVQPKYGLISASNTKMPTKGLTKFVISVGTCRAHFSLWVMDGAVSPCILGYKMLRKLGALVNCTRACLQFGNGGEGVNVDEMKKILVCAAVRTESPAPKEEIPIDWTESSLSAEQKEQLRKVLLKFDLFVTTSKAPGRTDLVKCYINTAGDSPIKQAPFRVAQKEGEIMEAEIKQYLELGLIRKSTSPWASPVLMIRKPDGSIGFCIDYRRLNDVTVKDCYPIPRVHDLLDVLGKSKYFSTMDVASGYWNVRMDEESIEKTAFTCKFGLYEWLVMPFGLCNAVPQFQRLMEGVLQEYIWRPLERLKGALDALKRKLTSPPILVYPDFDLPFTIFVDACPIALGAVLMQEQGGRHRVIAYASQALDATQQRWISKKDGTSEIECYGLVWATGKFRPYIDRRHFTVYTDHAALVWLYKTGSKSGNGKLARWAVHLQNLDFTAYKAWTSR